MQKSAKDVGVNIIDKRRRNNLKYCQSSNLLAIAGPNERLVDLSTSDINETKAKQQNHVIKIINKNNNNNNKKTMRYRERDNISDARSTRIHSILFSLFSKEQLVRKGRIS
jgi:hypothetical protein